MKLSASVGLSLTPAELPRARDVLAAQLSVDPNPDLYLGAGLVSYLLADFDSARTQLQRAYLDYRHTGNRPRAALTAAHLGRLEHDGVGNLAAANGWIARSHRLIEREPACPEQGWVALGRVGCSFVDADDLERNATLALKLAEDFDETDLECKALADLGVALVGHGRVEEGMSRLDEAMTMTTSGECSNAFILAQVNCCVVTACERSSDLSRMASWLRTFFTDLPGLLDPGHTPSMLLSHCQGEYGSLLCGTGRWLEADQTLREAVRVGDLVHYRPQARAHAALADLRVSQGRLAEAAAMLDGYSDSIEAQLPLARLHLARGDHALAATVARRAARALVGDVLRGAPLYDCVIEAEIARGRVAAAKAAAATLSQFAEQVGHRPVHAMAHLGCARVELAEGDFAAAAISVERGLTALRDGQWPLLVAELHLVLARALADGDRPAALAEAREALRIFATVGAARMHEAQSVLHGLGEATTVMPPGPVGMLTAREREVLRLLATGTSNPDIARALVISPKTAEHHVSNILRKLQLTSRSEAAVYAATLGAP